MRSGAGVGATSTSGAEGAATALSAVGTAARSVGSGSGVAGANQMGGIQFTVSKQETLTDEARNDAMANALRRAKLFATAGGAELGEIVQIAEDVSAAPGPVVFARAKAMAPGAAVPVQRGSEQLEARVTATWRLK